MLGNFQQSQLRIEVDADRKTIGECLLHIAKLRQWMWPQNITTEVSDTDTLELGLDFTSKLGIIEIQHQVVIADDGCLRLLLSKGIDGYHEWCWGDGWVQSRLEGISLLPLNLGQTLSLLGLRQYLHRLNLDRETNPDTSV